MSLKEGSKLEIHIFWSYKQVATNAMRMDQIIQAGSIIINKREDYKATRKNSNIQRSERRGGAGEKKEKGTRYISDGIKINTFPLLMSSSFVYGFFGIKVVSPRSEGHYSFLYSYSSCVYVPLHSCWAQNIAANYQDISLNSFTYSNFP